MIRARTLISQLATKESQFLLDEFISPVVKNSSVLVRLGGAICRLQINSTNKTGWCIFQPTSFTAATFVREASLRERQKYLQSLPQLRMLLSQKVERGWLAIPAHRGDRRVQIEGEVPIQLIENAQQFSVVRARFDGRNFWYDQDDHGHDLGRANYLREALAKAIEPNRLRRSGLTPEEQAAYALRYFESTAVVEQLRKDNVRERLTLALQHAGAEFVDYAEHSDGYRVTYRIGGLRYVSSVDKRDLSVQVAGICLSGEDAKFDLQSLVSVLHESRGHA